MKIVHDKLVRDRIPEIIAQSGRRCSVRTLAGEDYLARLDAKLNEETAEYQQSKSIEELADILEVVYAIACARGSSVNELERVRAEKAERRGGFECRILLIDVRDD